MDSHGKEKMTTRKFDCWQELDEAYTQFSNAKNKYLKLREAAMRSIDVAEVLKLGTPGVPRDIAFEKAANLSIGKRKEIFPDLVAYASYTHGFTEASRNLILSLPREWVLSNIEKIADPILKNGGYEEYSAILALYKLISPSIFNSLINYCASSDNSELREAASNYIGK